MFRRSRTGSRPARRARSTRSGFSFGRKPLFELLEDRRLLAIVTVTTDSDVDDGTTTSIADLISTPGADGVISLREAITAANNTANAGGPDEIHFAITPLGGVKTIQPTSELPAIIDPVIIDGYTQSGASANTGGGQTLNTTLTVEINGQLAGGAASGLRITAGGGGSTIR